MNEEIVRLVAALQDAPEKHRLRQLAVFMICGCPPQARKQALSIARAIYGHKAVHEALPESLEGCPSCY